MKQEKTSFPSKQTLLTQLGLTEKEIQVYLTGVGQAPLPISLLAKKAGVPRTQCYEIVKSLEEKSLCSNLGSDYGRRISFSDPTFLKKLLHKKQEELKQSETGLDTLIKTLNASVFTGPFIEPKVQFAKGVENLRKMFWKSLETKDDTIYSMLFDPDVLLVMGYEARVKRNIKSKSLSPAPVHDPNPLFSQHKEVLREVRYAPKSISINSTILIFDNHVLFITTHEEPFGTLIESKDFASTLKSMFETVWGISKKK
jgi:sugar-specific transcriptional regulator TrmB